MPMVLVRTVLSNEPLAQTAGALGPVGAGASWTVAAASLAFVCGVAAALAFVKRFGAAERRLKDCEERHELVLRGSNDGVWDWVVGGDRLFVSERGHELLGRRGDDARIKRMSEVLALVHRDDRKDVRRAIDAHLLRRTPFAAECRFKLADGTYKWFRVRGQATWNSAGEATRMAGGVSDIDDLMCARDASNTANELKSQFLANMSHEIRTPMSGVMGMAQLLLKTDLDERQRRFIDTILDASRALLALINDILDLSKIEAGLMTQTVDSIDLRMLVADALSRVEGVAADKALAVRSEIESDCEGAFEGDARRINQVLVNLLANAIKFTERGEVVLAVARGASGGLRFTVRDTGPGIAAEHVAVIFERFRQADGSPTRKHGGTGLGLAIAKELVQLMKGSIGVESVVGQGSSFWFELPAGIERVAGIDAGRDADRERAKADASLRGLRALVAEDSVSNQVVVLEMLHDLGVDARLARDGAEALKTLEGERFDFALMDIHMPELNGDAVIRALRSGTSPNARIPIVVVTADAMKGRAARFLEAGADACVAKPVDLDQLTQTIRDAIDRKRARSAA